MEITDVKIRKAFDQGALRAVASVTFDDQMAVHDIKIIYANERYFIIMPSRKISECSYRDIAHPINSQFRKKLEGSVLDAYFDKLNDDGADENEAAGTA